MDEGYSTMNGLVTRGPGETEFHVASKTLKTFRNGGHQFKEEVFHQDLRSNTHTSADDLK